MIRVSILSLCLSILLILPVYANEYCASGHTTPPDNPRLETTLKVDLSDNNEGSPAFLEWYTLPADQAVRLTMQNKTVPAQALAVGDTIVMEGGQVGRITSSETHLFTPESQYVNGQAQGYQRVLAKSKRWTNTLLLIHTHNETIETTPEHPFHTQDQWVEAQDLQPGALITSVNAQPVIVEDTEVITGGRFVYNLKVEGPENFFVGINGLLAHNCVLGPAGDIFDACSNANCPYNPTSIHQLQATEDNLGELGQVLESAGIIDDISHADVDDLLSGSSALDREISSLITKREAKNARSRAYKAANRKTINAKARAYKASNREAENARSRAYKAANRETLRANSRATYAKKRASMGMTVKPYKR